MQGVPRRCSLEGPFKWIVPFKSNGAPAVGCFTGSQMAITPNSGTVVRIRTSKNPIGFGPTYEFLYSFVANWA